MKTETIAPMAVRDELNLDPRLARETPRIAAREPKKYPELSRGRKPRAARA